MSRPITMSARTIEQAQASSAAMQRDFVVYMPAKVRARHPSILRMSDALILSAIMLLVVLRWLLTTAPTLPGLQ